MSPEQEAQLRAQMAQARQEMEAEDGGDLDGEASPEAIQEKKQEQLGAMYPYLGWSPYLTDKYLAAVPAPDENAEEFQKPTLSDPNRVRQVGMEINRDLAPFMGAGWTAGVAASEYLQGDMKNRQKQEEQKGKEEDLAKKEENIRKALENAKRIKAYQAAQEKATKDRDETIAKGGRGYRVEYPLYDSTLYRK